MRALQCGLIILLLLIAAGCSKPAPAPVTTQKAAAVSYRAEAEQCLAEGKLRNALDLFEQFLKQNPGDREIVSRIKQVKDQLQVRAHQCYLNGRSLEKQGCYEKAEQLFLKAETLWPDHLGAGEILKAYTALDEKPFIIHSIREGDNISGLTMYYYGDYDKLVQLGRANRLKNSARLKIGQKIKIPEFEGTTINGLKLKQSRYLAGSAGNDNISATAPSRSETPWDTGSSAMVPEGNIIPEKATEEDDSPEINTSQGESHDFPMQQQAEKAENVPEGQPRTLETATAGIQPAQPLISNPVPVPGASDTGADPPATMKTRNTQTNPLSDYQWDKKVFWGISPDRLNELFQGKLKKKVKKQSSFLEYFDFLSIAHAKDKTVTYYYLEQSFRLGACNYKPLFTMDRNDKLVQVTLTSEDRECSCHGSVIQSLCSVYGDPVKETDNSFSAVEDYSTHWHTEDTLIMKNLSVTSLGKSCNIIYKKRDRE